MNFLRRLWHAMTVGERVLLVCALLCYVAFPNAVIYALVNHDFRVAISLGGLSTAVTVALTASLRAPKGKGF